MSSSRRAVIRADASAQIGAGHVMRCLALAEALRCEGWQPAFAATQASYDAVAALRATDYEKIVVTDAGDAAELAAAAGDSALLVIDHYQLDDEYESACRSWAGLILAIDDLADRRHDCDWLLDQTIARTAVDYSGLVSRNCTILAGTDFALLRREFAMLRGHRQVRPQVRRVFVSLGATDAAGLLAGLLEEIHALLPECAIDAAVGSASLQLPAIRRAAARTGCTLHVDAANMATLMSQADLAVLASGSTVLEAACMALPMVALPVADNQRALAAALHTRGAARVAYTREQVSALLAELASDSQQRARLADAAGGRCDGRGARRTLLAIRPERARDGRSVGLRPATMADATFLLKLQSFPQSRRFARHTAIPGEDEHFAWLRGRLSDARCLLNIVLWGSEPVGTLRLDRRTQPDGNGYEISIVVDPARMRLGIGVAALAAARRLVSEEALHAHVLPENEPSHALFSAAGFSRDGDWYVRHGVQPALHGGGLNACH